MKKLTNFKWLGLILVLSGCSMEASIMDLTAPIAPLFEKSSGAEFVAGATAEYKETDSKNYKVMASVGHYLPKQAVKTPRGYIVFSSVQGNMISDEFSTQENMNWSDFNPE